jgi:hypothetical protein
MSISNLLWKKKSGFYAIFLVYNTNVLKMRE